MDWWSTPYQSLRPPDNFLGLLDWVVGPSEVVSFLDLPYKVSVSDHFVGPSDNILDHIYGPDDLLDHQITFGVINSQIGVPDSFPHSPGSAVLTLRGASISRTSSGPGPRGRPGPGRPDR